MSAVVLSLRCELLASGSKAPKVETRLTCLASQEEDRTSEVWLLLLLLLALLTWGGAMHAKVSNRSQAVSAKPATFRAHWSLQLLQELSVSLKVNSVLASSA